MTLLTKHEQRVYDFFELHKGEMFSTREIAKELHMAWRSADERLNIIYSENRNIHKNVKEKLTLWFIPKEKHMKNMKQIYDPSCDMWKKFNTKKGEFVGIKKDGKPFKNVEIYKKMMK